jgi:pyruvate,water dikinase
MASHGLPVPPGFVVCAAAFEAFLQACGGDSVILDATLGLDVHDSAALAAASDRIRALIRSSELPADAVAAIRFACEAMGNGTRLAVRSSAIGEDGETASFAGQQETYLNVRGPDETICRVRDCWASFFTPRAMFYRTQKGSLRDMRMAVVVQEMVLAEKSGVMFTVDPVHKIRGHMTIEAVFGLGEGIVSGMITPDHYVLDRASGALVREFIAPQYVAVVPDDAGGTKEIDLSEAEGERRVLADDDLRQLREWGIRLDDIFGAPQDVEWCIRGNEMFLLQSRPITNL